MRINLLKLFGKKNNGVNLINLSIRYVKRINVSILNYAKNNMYAFVLFLNVGNNQICYEYLENWTRDMIDFTLSLNGTYYLPYLPLATIKQFRTAYPNYTDYLQIKSKYDPKKILSNLFIEKYLKS